MILKAKIQNKKILFSHDRIICNEKSMYFDELKTFVNNYLLMIKAIKNSNGIIFNQEKLNFGIRFRLFDIFCTVGLVFQIYNEIAEEKGIETFSKLWYNPKDSIKFSPS